MSAIESKIKGVVSGSHILDEVLTDYFLRLEDGEQVDCRSFVAEHPEIQEELEVFFETYAEAAVRVRELARAGDDPDNDGPGLIALPTFSKFRMLRGIKRGGMGDVFLAEQLPFNREVAVKLIRADRVADPELVGRFEREAKTASQLSHPGIVAVHDAGAEHGFHYLIMEYIPGTDLADILNGGPLNPPDAARIVNQVAMAVQVAHEQGVLHRDLKPANIIVDSRTGRPKITDFGLAKNQQFSIEMTKTGNLVGTPNYMSPEQTGFNSISATEKSDVFSLGATLYHLITGQPPFEGASIADTLRQIAYSEPRRPSLLNQEIDADLEVICLKALTKEPSARYETAQALSEDLNRYITGEPIKARQPTLPARARAWARNNQLAATALVFMALLTTLGIGSAIVYRQLSSEAAFQRQSAVTAADKERAVAEFFTDILKSPDPSVDGKDFTVTAALDRAIPEARSRFMDKPDVLARILTVASGSYAGLGLGETGTQLGREAIELLSDLPQDHPRMVQAQLNLAASFEADEQFDESLQILQLQIESIEATKFDESRKLLIAAITQVARLKSAMSRFDSAIIDFDRAVQLSKIESGDFSQVNCAVRASRAQALVAAGRYKEAEDDLDAILSSTADLSELTEIDCLLQMGKIHRELHGEIDEAIECHEQALEVMQSFLGVDHPRTIQHMFPLAISYLHKGRNRDAVDLMERRLAAARSRYPEEHVQIAAAKADLCSAYYSLKSTDRCKQLLEEAVPILDTNYGRFHVKSCSSRQLLGMTLLKLGEIEPAREHLEHAFETATVLFENPTHPNVLRVQSTLAICAAAAGQTEQAEKLFRDSLAARLELYNSNKTNSRNVQKAHEILCDFYLGNERYEEAAIAISAWENFLVSIDVETSSLNLRRMKAELNACRSLSTELAILESVLNEEESQIKERRGVVCPGHASSLLGQQLSLVGKEPSQAELYLRQGAERLLSVYNRTPRIKRYIAKSAIQRLIAHYERSNRTEEADTWRKNLRKLATKHHENAPKSRDSE